METGESYFILLYRLNKSAFQMVLEQVSPDLPKCFKPKTIQLAAALRFLAVGSYQGVIANDVNISMGRSTFCKALWKVMNALENTLCPTWIQIAMNQQRELASKFNFYEKFGIPGVVGCVDATLIKLLKPPSDHAVYFSRKGHFSINAMIICDYEMHILAIDACRPGSCHDSFVWKMSDSRRYYAEMYSEGARHFRLLGDSGYGLTPYLMTPYNNAEYGSVQHTFNKRHASARNIVERTIGVLKSRFRCLQNSLPYTPAKVVNIINLCCALYNICNHYSVPFQEEITGGNYDDEDDDNVESEPTEADDDNGNSRNMAITIRDNIAYSLNENFTI